MDKGFKMYVEKATAQEVFKDNNKGFKFGLFQSLDHHDVCDYVEWFKTEEERNKTIKENKFIVVNE